MDSPKQMYDEAMRLQHEGSADDILNVAHPLAQSALNRGYEPARWLIAATYDRYLMISGQPCQKYGTQYRLDPKTSHYKLYPVNPKTTDEERSEFNIQPINEIPLTWNHPD